MFAIEFTSSSSLSPSHFHFHLRTQKTIIPPISHSTQLPCSLCMCTFNCPGQRIRMETLEKSVAAKQDTRRSQWKSLKCYSYSRMLSANRGGAGIPPKDRTGVFDTSWNMCAVAPGSCSSSLLAATQYCVPISAWGGMGDAPLATTCPNVQCEHVLEGQSLFPSLFDNSIMKLCCLRNENIIKIMKENKLSMEKKY